VARTHPLDGVRVQLERDDRGDRGLAGVQEVGTLIAIFGVNAAMILFGWRWDRERGPRPDPSGSTTCSAALPRRSVVVIFVTLLVSARSKARADSRLRIAIFVSLFVSFNVFAINQVLQYRKIGRWRDYLYGERAYMLFSLIAKSLLAWQVFFGTLKP